MIPIKVTQPTYSKPAVTIVLIVINILVFLNEFWLQLVDPYSLNHFMAQYSLRPAYFHFENVFTAMFVHATWMHVLGNMLFLWVFGDNVEHRAGPALYLLLYLAFGVIGSLAQVLTAVGSVIPTLGASGAISGVLGAYIVLFPTNRVTVFLFRFFVQVPAAIAIGIWIVFQLISGFGAGVVSDESGGVAYMAHIGGFAAGVVAGLMLRTFTRPGGPPLQRAW
jgi:membrane associated rhomboid family serine protease